MVWRSYARGLVWRGKVWEDSRKTLQFTRYRHPPGPLILARSPRGGRGDGMVTVFLTLYTPPRHWTSSDDTRPYMQVNLTGPLGPRIPPVVSASVTQARWAGSVALKSPLLSSTMLVLTAVTNLNLLIIAGGTPLMTSSGAAEIPRFANIFRK